jgi:phosphodiesterase/alkaline phosphatase D-like protein
MVRITHSPLTKVHNFQDAWDGYRASRARVLDHIERNKIDNTIVLSGDSHANWASDRARKPIVFLIVL